MTDVVTPDSSEDFAERYAAMYSQFSEGMLGLPTEMKLTRSFGELIAIGASDEAVPFEIDQLALVKELWFAIAELEARVLKLEGKYPTE